MKYIAFFSIILIILFSTPLIADNNIMIMADTIWSSTFDVPFGFENDVPLYGISNGFRISATGGLTAGFMEDSFYLDEISRDGQIPGTIGWGANFDWAPEFVLVGGFYI